MAKCENMEQSHPCLDINEMVQTLGRFTQTYMESCGDHPALREAKCYRVLWPATLFTFASGDRFAGRIANPPIGFSPQHDGGFMGYYVNEPEVDVMLADADLLPENRDLLHKLRVFWRENNTVLKCKQAFDADMRSCLPSDNYAGESGIAFTLWRMAGVQLDFSKLMRLGIDGLKDEVARHRTTSDCSPDTESLYRAMEMSLDSFSEVALFYADMCAEMATLALGSPTQEYRQMEQVLRKISHGAPTTFREGLQLAYLYALVGGVRNFGRMDDFLSELYAQDTVDDEEVIELICSLWRLMKERRTDIYMSGEGSDSFRYDTRVVIGGAGRENPVQADKVASLIMEASSRMREIVPQLALRFGKGQNEALRTQAMDILASGYTFPMLYNDDVNIVAAQRAFDVQHSHAEQVIQYGCGEYVLYHMSVGTPSGVLNLLHALSVTLHMGVDPLSGVHQGMPLDRYEKYDRFATFEQLVEAYKEQVEYHVEQLAKHEELEYAYAAKDNAYLFLSILMDDCIVRGRGVFDGGVRYLGGTLETYGNINVADSLLAIREYVYEQQKCTLDDLVAMLDCNFEGYEHQRLKLAALPKYGNDNEAADQMACMVHDHVCTTTRNQREKRSLHSYMVVVINNDANTLMGLHTATSADGRHAFLHMNPGNNPMSGADRSGITALLNSLIKPRTDIHAGAVQNMKFSRELFSSHREMVELALESYFDRGGAQAMLTVVGREDMEKAMIEPEKYGNLIVRVGGFSERFVNLPAATQREVLERTLY